MALSADSFFAGMAYGCTTVCVGQPFDTIKTRMQALQTNSAIETAKQIISKDGLKGLYKGGMALVVGGALIRSAQFGVNDYALCKLKSHFGPQFGEENRVLGVFNPLVIFAGFCGGISRGLVEGPFEYIKTRKQVDKPWVFKEMLNGSSATIFRNSFLVRSKKMMELTSFIFSSLSS